MASLILVTGFEPFGGHGANPSEEVAQALAAMLEALTAAGIPAYVSSPAGTFLCNQTLYTTLHAIHDRPAPPAAGFVHLPLLPAMVAAAGLDAPSMDLAVMRRAVEVGLAVIARSVERR